MTKRLLDLAPHPLLDIVSYGRGGATLTPARREAIARTVGGVPEVVVKVSGGGSTVGGVTAHLRYIGRHGRLPLELDEGDEVASMSDVRALIRDWGLKTEEMASARRYSGRPGIKGPRLVYNLVFSMPASTPPTKVLNAVRNFAHEQWALEHRYAMALHTDTPRPHVHVALKAVSEQGQRLHIDRERLRRWREEFARHLRAQGVSANATHRAVRGRVGHGPPTKLYRAMHGGASTFLGERVRKVAAELQLTGSVKDSAGAKLRETRRGIEGQWKAVRQVVERSGDTDLASGIDRFLASMPTPQTEIEEISRQIQERLVKDRRPSITAS
ncbi:MAG: relaxase/mobilization nuclease domain-containing protein [Gammaproteobacteria bacterium]